MYDETNCPACRLGFPMKCPSHREPVTVEPEPVDVTAPGFDCGAAAPDQEGGAAFNTCKVQNPEAGILRCAACAEREAQRIVAVELQTRTNYCRAMGHQWTVVRGEEDQGEMILACLNQCSYSGAFKLVPRG